MTVDWEELGKRAVACQGWKWMPGMLGWRTNHKGEKVRVRFVECVEDQELVDPQITLRKPSMTPIVQWGFATVAGWSEVATILPDLRDPATLGCLLLLVREVCGKETWVQHEDEWVCWVISEGCVIPYFGKTEAEALVTALEASP